MFLRSVVKRIKTFSRTDGRDVCDPINDPNPALVESSGQVKARPGFFKSA